MSEWERIRATYRRASVVVALRDPIDREETRSAIPVQTIIRSAIPIIFVGLVGGCRGPLSSAVLWRPGAPSSPRLAGPAADTCWERGSGEARGGPRSGVASRPLSLLSREEDGRGRKTATRKAGSLYCSSVVVDYPCCPDSYPFRLQPVRGPRRRLPRGGARRSSSWPTTTLATLKFSTA